MNDLIILFMCYLYLQAFNNGFGLNNTQIILEISTEDTLCSGLGYASTDNKSVKLNVCGSEGWDIFWGTCAK